MPVCRDPSVGIRNHFLKAIVANGRGFETSKPVQSGVSLSKELLKVGRKFRTALEIKLFGIKQFVGSLPRGSTLGAKEPGKVGEVNFTCSAWSIQWAMQSRRVESGGMGKGVSL